LTRVSAVLVFASIGVMVAGAVTVGAGLLIVGLAVEYAVGWVRG